MRFSLHDCSGSNTLMAPRSKSEPPPLITSGTVRTPSVSAAISCRAAMARPRLPPRESRINVGKIVSMYWNTYFERLRAPVAQLDRATAF